VATQKVVHGDLNFALTKGIGCVRAGLIWLYNLVLLLALVLVCKFLDRMLEFVMIIKLYFPYPITGNMNVLSFYRSQMETRKDD
jgi:hypothetical protein